MSRTPRAAGGAAATDPDRLTAEDLVPALRRALEIPSGVGPQDSTADEEADVDVLARIDELTAEVDGRTDVESLKLAARRLLEQRIHRLSGADRAVADIVIRHHRSSAERVRRIAAHQGVSSKVARRRRDATLVTMAALLLPAPKQRRRDEGWRRRDRILAAIGIVVGVVGIAVGIAEITTNRNAGPGEVTGAATVTTAADPPTTSSPTTDPTSTTPTTGTSTSGPSLTGPTSTDPAGPTTSFQPGEIPEGDHFDRMRPASSLGKDLRPGETWVIEILVERDGWLVLDFDCQGEHREYPEHDGAFSVTAYSAEVYWQPPNPITDCTNDFVQGPVTPGSYVYRVQLSPNEPEQRPVGLVARYVTEPFETSWEGRPVLTRLDLRPTDSISNTIVPGTIHAYTYFMTNRDQLFISFNCNDVTNPPTETPLRVRVIDEDGVAFEDRVVDDCVPYRTEFAPTDGRYELQVMAVDPADGTFYRMAAPFQN